MGEDLPQLGSKKEVVSTLTQLVPTGDFSDTSWGVLDGDDFSIEFSLGNDDPIIIIMLYVRGSDKAINVIQKICEHTGWRAYDTSRDEFINFVHNPEAGFEQWRAYKDSVVTYLESQGKNDTKDVSDK